MFQFDQLGEKLKTKTWVFLKNYNWEMLCKVVMSVFANQFFHFSKPWTIDNLVEIN